MKHKPFDSIYREKFEVVQERRDNARLYPHTEQLPLLSRALNLEFYGTLPDRIARVDHRADDYHKVLLQLAAYGFCNGVNASRTDDVRLQPVYTPDLVTKIAVVQHITESSPLGSSHRFRLFSGKEFIPDIHLSGRRIAFAEHVLQRFSRRVPHNVGTDISTFLEAFFTKPIIAMPVGDARAFIVPHFGSILGFTFKERDDQYFVTTCLTVQQINRLELERPTYVANMHYGPTFTKPLLRNWVPDADAMEAIELWKRKAPFYPEAVLQEPFPPWRDVAGRMPLVAKRQGFERCKLVFLDNVHGPAIRFADPDVPNCQYDVRETYRKAGLDHMLADDPSPTGTNSNSTG